MALAALTVGSTAMFATPIPYASTGVINGTSTTGVLVAVTSNAPCIAFSGATTCSIPPATTPYDITGGVGPGATDSIYATGTAQGNIKDIGVNQAITSFKTANLTIGGGPAMFDLLNIITPSGFAACNLGPGQSVCSTGTFVLVQSSPSQVSITLSTNELGYITSPAGGTTPYQGIFTAQISGSLVPFGCTSSGAQTCSATIQNILLFESTSAQTNLAGFGTVGQSGTIKAAWSVQESPITSSVPEPTSFVLIGGGLLGLGFFAKRRKSVA